MTCREFEAFVVAGGADSLFSADEQSPQRGHFEVCVRCHAMVEDLLNLRSTVRRLRESYDAGHVPDMRGELLREFRRQHSIRPPQFVLPQLGARGGWAIAAAAMVMFAVAVGYVISSNRKAGNPNTTIVVQPKAPLPGQEHRPSQVSAARRPQAGANPGQRERPRTYARAGRATQPNDDHTAQAPTATTQARREVRTGFITIQPAADTGDTERSIVRMKLPSSSVLPLGIPVSPVQEDLYHRVTADVVVDQFGNAQAIRLVSPNPGRPK